MARIDVEAWIPEEWGGPVITKVLQTSAVEAVARREPMATDTRHVLRTADADIAVVAKGAAYGEDASTNDEVLLSAKKFGRIIRIAQEDIADTSTVANVLETKRLTWFSSYAKMIDNAALGVTAASNGTTIPFTSVYRAVSQYSSGVNLTQTAGATTYADLSKTLANVEGGDYWSEGSTVVIAHPFFKSVIRDIVDGENRPVFQPGAETTPDTLFGYPIRWSLGAKTSATATNNPSAGNPLLIVGAADLLILGVRSGPESMVSTEAAFNTDEYELKVRARRGFAVGDPAAFSVIEVTAP